MPIYFTFLALLLCVRAERRPHQGRCQQARFPFCQGSEEC